MKRSFSLLISYLACAILLFFSSCENPIFQSVPDAPTGVSASAGNASVTISWTNVSGATSYNIYWSTSSGVSPVNGTKIQNATSPYIHSGRTNGTTYYYVVTAVNAGGESSPSSFTYATPSIPWYYVYYNGNGNTGGSVPPTSTNISGDSHFVKGNIGGLIKTGYTFGGWNNSPNGDGTSYSTGEVITIGNSDIYLYAVWLPLSEMNEAEFNDSSTYANEIVPQIPMAFRLGSTSDQDWFKLYITANQLMNLDFIVPSGISGFWTIYVYKPDLTLLSQTNWNSTNNKYGIPCNLTGDYYIRITPYSGGFLYNDSTVQIKVSTSPW